MRPPPGVLVLLDHVAVVGTSVSFATAWTPVPPDFQVEQIVIVCHSTNSGTSLNVAPETTWDTALVAQVGSAIPIASQGVTPQDLTSGIGPWIRLQLAGSSVSHVISVWLTPKRF